ncbi:MAG: M3 family oligoendopeptidase [Bacteroidetes bacterium]|nr:M3 family oligoendopeptidase [Bacteroidota bacterium]
MNFKEFNYYRPDLASISKNIDSLLVEFEKAGNAKSQMEIIDKVNEIRNDFNTQRSIAGVKYTQDTTNADYQAEQDFFDELSPAFLGLEVKFYETISRSKFKQDLILKYGNQLFSVAQMTVDTFSDSIVEELQKENQLGSEYTKLLGSAKIKFDNKELNLSELGSYLNSKDRTIRKAANEAKYNFFSSNKIELDRLFDDLVKVRASIAKKLGFNNFVELGYKRMLRGDYNAQMVSDYRDQVKKYIVPLTEKLAEKQAKRIGLDKLYYYDEALSFKSGNAVPKGSPDWIVDNAKKMYSELSPETGEFFQFMTQNELLDLESRSGKAVGGYCTYFSNYKSPFIFSNFNGTAHDIIVLTHEAGHAFQGFCSRKFDVPEYNFPTYEACEIHSMSMEFLTWPWMDLFFKEDTDKFKYSHVAKSLIFLPYGVAVDEFQHWIYENPNVTSTERNAQWRKIEQKYIPYRNYDDNKYLEDGGYWQQQRHIYESPFYYIDYTLAQICAFQFWKKFNQNKKEAMSDYLELCKAGGSKSFLELVEIANIDSPFKEGCLESVATEVNNWLLQVDDSRLN